MDGTDRAVQRDEVKDHAGHRPRDEPEEAAPARRAAPEHAQKESPEQRRQEDAVQELDVVDDAREAEHQVRREHAQGDARHGGYAAHVEVVAVGGVPVDVRLVDVVGPDGVEGRNVAGHPAHERGEQRRQADAEHPCREVVGHRVGDGHVVVVLAEVREDGQDDQAGEDRQHPVHELRERRDERGPLRRGLVLGRQRPLHYEKSVHQ
jgi:hypothetical protein